METGGLQARLSGYGSPRRGLGVREDRGENPQVGRVARAGVARAKTAERVPRLRLGEAGSGGAP